MQAVQPIKLLIIGPMTGPRETAGVSKGTESRARELLQKLQTIDMKFLVGHNKLLRPKLGLGPSSVWTPIVPKPLVKPWVYLARACLSMNIRVSGLSSKNKHRP